MLEPLRVLIVEDSVLDAELVVTELQRGGYDVAYTRVQTAQAMAEALAGATWDVIVSDHELPGFSGPAALALLQASQLDIPFIVISGRIGEELAVSSLKAGADDFLIKDSWRGSFRSSNASGARSANVANTSAPRKPCADRKRSTGRWSKARYSVSTAPRSTDDS